MRMIKLLLTQRNRSDGITAKMSDESQRDKINRNVMFRRPNFNKCSIPLTLTRPVWLIR